MPKRMILLLALMEIRYGCNFVFCRPEESACVIYRILERGI